MDVSVKIGGAAGQGIQTVGQLIAKICKSKGFHVFAINDFESRIRGGHSFFQIRIAEKNVRAPHQTIQILVCLTRETFEFHREEVDHEGIILVESEMDISGENVLSLPLNEMAKEAGDKATVNTVAASVCLTFLGAPLDMLEKAVRQFFKSKEEDIIKKNIAAAQKGHDAVQEKTLPCRLEWGEEKLPLGLINGAQAIALGALSGDCRFAAFYPMSPATEIMANLANASGEFPLVVEQAEDEISAVNMIIGASFAGVRSMTATSGGGFSLMTEALGLSGITETPIVIVNAQRPGPATGLPTRTAQADLLFVIHASQDEFPRFVFSPGSPEEAYHATAKALNLTDKYQVPAIVLADHHLITSLFTIDEKLPVPDNVDRYISEDKDLKDPAHYNRYEITDSGISPRALPCKGDALVISSGNEHHEDGHISEAISDRNRMVRKRFEKETAMVKDMAGPEALYPDAQFYLVGWGSTKGMIAESVRMLREESIDVGALHFCDIWPFPTKDVKKLLEEKPFFMVEQNATAQLGQLIRAMTGLSFKDTILKYDGRPFMPHEITESVKKKI